jgi:hypothetical protein
MQNDETTQAGIRLVIMPFLGMRPLTIRFEDAIYLVPVRVCQQRVLSDPVLGYQDPASISWAVLWGE